MGFFRDWRRKRVLTSARIDGALWARIASKLSFLRGLSTEETARLKQLVLLFLAEKEMHGAHGFKLTDDVRLSIAAQACLPILNLGLDVYNGWVGVVVYPGEFRVRKEEMDEHGIVHTFDEELAGEAGPCGFSGGTRRNGRGGMAQGPRSGLRAFLQRGRLGSTDLHRRVRRRAPGRVLRRDERSLLHRVGRARARLAGAIPAVRAFLPAGSGGTLERLTGPRLSSGNEVQSLGQRTVDRDFEKRPYAVGVDHQYAVGGEEHGDLSLRAHRERRACGARDIRQESVRILRYGRIGGKREIVPEVGRLSREIARADDGAGGGIGDRLVAFRELEDHRLRRVAAERVLANVRGVRDGIPRLLGPFAVLEIFL